MAVKPNARYSNLIIQAYVITIRRIQSAQHLDTVAEGNFSFRNYKKVTARLRTFCSLNALFVYEPRTRTHSRNEAIIHLTFRNIPESCVSLQLKGLVGDGEILLQ